MKLNQAVICTSLLFIAGLPLAAAGNGLKGEYFNNTAHAGTPVLTRTDGTVNFEWFGSPGPGVPSSYFSVRWSGKVEAPVTGAYQFATYSNEAVRVWIDNNLIIDNWTAHATAKDTAPSVSLTAGMQYDLRIDLRESTGGSAAKLLWTFPGQAETVVPQDRLYSAPVSAAPAPVYLSDLTPAYAVNGWGLYEKDRANGGSRNGDGGIITVEGVRYSRGLGVNAASDLRYQLMGRYQTFVTEIGIDDEVGNLGSAVFEVWLDGTRRYVSSVLRGTDGAVPVSLNVTGVNELSLRVFDGGDGISSDHGDWAGARLLSAAPTPTPVPTPPATPAGLTAVPGSSQVSLAWTAVSGTVTYNVYRGTGGTVLAAPYAMGVATNSFKDTAVSNGTAYSYRVAAVSGGLTGGLSNLATATPQNSTQPPPMPPTGVRVIPGNSQISVSWSPAASATGYHVFRSSVGGALGSRIASNLTSTNMMDRGLTNGATYFYSVVAYNSGGESAPSEQVSGAPVAAAGPRAPSSLTAIPGNGSVTLRWSIAGSGASVNVYRGTSSGGQAAMPIASGITGMTFNDTGLTNGTTYFYTVAAVSGSGISAMSNEASATPAVPVLLPAPTGFSATAGNTEITLNWTPVDGAVSYNLYRSTVTNGQGNTPYKTGILTPPFKDTGLTNGTTYFYRVAAVNGAGVGAKSSQASAKPVLPPKPSTPSGLTATPGTGTVTLAWNAANNATTYNIYRSTTSNGQGDTPFATGITGLTWTNSGLTNGTTYYYKVAGVNVTGIGNKSSQASATPFAQPTVLTPDQMSAFKFLRQSTWGPTPDLVNRVAQIGKAAFLDEQFRLPATPYPQALVDMPNMELVSEQFFQNALQGQDQLRQRVAWALSQIWVVSAVKVDNTHAMVPYIRMLQENAFGNVRDLLELVTLSPAMGEFLDMVNNKKAANGAMPNENYARELLQLFTLGLTTLNPDGTPGPTAPYTQNDVLELSRVLTGWTYGDAIAGDPTKINKAHYLGPMEPVAIYHDTGAKTVLGVNFPANQSARADLALALDTLYNHPNIGPFLVKQLIQRLVKSSPSPQYVADVVGVFNNNGQGVRGDLRAVVRAILLHNEAAETPSTGKFSEPALFLTTIARGLNSTVTDHPYMTDFSQDMGQRIWFAPSVFNYFSPGYRSSAVPGGILAPELQIWSTATAMTRVNFVASLVSGGFGTNFTIDTTPYLPFVGSPAALVDEANARLMGGTMGAEMRQAIITALGSATSNTDRIRTVLYLIGSSMQYQVEH